MEVSFTDMEIQIWLVHWIAMGSAALWLAGLIFLIWVGLRISNGIYNSGKRTFYCLPKICQRRKKNIFSRQFSMSSELFFQDRRRVKYQTYFIPIFSSGPIKLCKKVHIK